jgi:hypothetical protein
MIFKADYSYANDVRDVVHKRFLESGGAPPPGNVKMLGRWHSAEGNGGVLLAEAADATAIAAWLHQWTDLIAFNLKPMLTDEEFGKMID